MKTLPRASTAKIQTGGTLMPDGLTATHFGKWHLTNAQTEGAPKPEAYDYDEALVFNGGAG